MAQVLPSKKCLTRNLLPSAGRGPFAVRVGRRRGSGRWPAGAGAFVPSIQLQSCSEEPGTLQVGILDSCSNGCVVASNDSCRMHAGASRGWLPPAGSCQPGRTRHCSRHQRLVWRRLEAHHQISRGRSRPAAQGQNSAGITSAALEELCESDFSHGALLAAVQGGCIAAFGLTLVSPAGSAPYTWSPADIVQVGNCLWLTAICHRMLQGLGQANVLLRTAVELGEPLSMQLLAQARVYMLCLLCGTVGNTAARRECLGATQQLQCSSPGNCGLCRLRCAAARACCSLLQLLRCLKRAWHGKSYHGGCPEVNMSVDDRRVLHCTQVQAALRQHDPSLTACCLAVSSVLDCALPALQCITCLKGAQASRTNQFGNPS